MKKLQYIAFICIGFCSTLTTKAQEAISLMEAVELGLENNFNISFAKQSEKIAALRNNKAEAGILPTITAQVTAGNSFLDQSKNPTSFIQDLIISNSINAGANINWTLFNGFQMHIQKDVLELQYQTSVLETTLAIQNQIHAITLAYFEILIQEKILDQYSQNLKFSKDKLKWANVKKGMDYIAPIDYLLIKEAVLSDSILYIESVNQMKLAKKQLNFLCNVERDREFSLSDQLEIDFIEEDYEQLKEKVLQNSQIESLLLNIRLKELDQKSSKTSLYPSLGINGGSFITRSSNSIGDEKGIPGTNINYYINFGLNYNIFSGGQTRRQVKISKIEQELAMENKEKLSTELVHEFDNYFDSYNYFLSGLTLSKQMLTINQEIQEKANTLYQNGAYSHVQLREIQIRSIEGITAHYRQLKRLIDSKLEIDRLTR